MVQVLDVVAGFQLERPLGRGGMGVVYRARDERLGRWVALKLIAPEAASDATFRARFERECRLAATIDHPNVIPVYEAGQADGRLFLAMRLVEGTNLRTLIRSELRLSPPRALHLLEQVAAGLDAAHDRGLVHRDVKPQNILVVDPGAAEHVYLTDFGLAKVADEVSELTASGRWVGTPGYVAPEQLIGRPVDRRADVYGLGCVLFEMLTGHVPFDASSHGERLVAQLSAPPPRPSDELPDLPPGLDDVIAGALAKAPEDRFATAGELAAAARAALEEAPTNPAAVLPQRTGPGLPAPATPTFGRERDLAAVTTLLARHDVRCVTLTGTGGVGKTRLAMEVAREVASSFRDGVHFAWLGAVLDPARVADSLAQQLGARSESSDSGDAVVRLLARKDLLLVLDNFEHLLPAAPLIEEVREHCADVKILVTAREPLRLASERVYQVAPLNRTAASALFLDRAAAQDPGFSTTAAESDIVAEICTRLDGLPLALELAAARTAVLSPSELLDRLTDSLAILGGGRRDAPQRQQTLRATIDWSHDLLDEGERAAFAALAVFAGGAELDAVEAVTQADVGTLAALVSKNLVGRRETATGRTRLYMLSTVREYAAERLAQRADAAAVHERHCRYYVEFAEQAELGLRSREQPLWARRLDTELGNLRAAVAWARRVSRPDLAIRLAGAAGLFLGFQRGQLGEVKEWLEGALATGVGLPAQAHAKACLALAVALQNLGQTDGGLTQCRDAVRLYRSADDPPGLSKALAQLSFMEFEAPSGETQRAAAAGAEALQIARVAGDPWITLFALCANLWLAPDFATAKDFADEAIAIARDLGVPDQEAMLLSNIGFRALEEGAYEYARKSTTEAIALQRGEVDDLAGLAIGLGNLGLVATLEGDDDEAAIALCDALRTCREHGFVRPLAEVLVALAALAARASDHVRAARLCGAADAHACDAPTRTDRKLQAEARDAARGALGAAGWRSEWEHGRRLGFEDAIAYALGETEPATAAVGGT